MKLERIYQVLMGHLDKGFAAAPVVAPKQDYRTKGDPWIRVEFEPGETMGLEFGPDPVSFRKGLLRFLIYVPENSGRDRGLALSDELEELYRLYDPGGMFCSDPYTLTGDDDDKVNGFWHLEVRVPWQSSVEKVSNE